MIPFVGIKYTSSSYLTQSFSHSSPTSSSPFNFTFSLFLLNLPLSLSPPSLPLIPYLPPFLPPSLPPSLPSSLPPSLPSYLPPFLPPFLPPSLPPPGVFSINSTTGLVLLTGELNFELDPEYDLNILARDRGDPPLSSVAGLHIDVLNINDNSPRFLVSFYTEDVSEGMWSHDIT